MVSSGSMCHAFVRFSCEASSEEMVHLFILLPDVCFLLHYTTIPPSGVSAIKRTHSRNFTIFLIVTQTHPQTNDRRLATTQPRWLPKPTPRRSPKAKARQSNSLLEVAAANARPPPPTMKKHQRLPSAQ
jgi:hypothetical protein